MPDENLTISLPMTPPQQSVHLALSGLVLATVLVCDAPRNRARRPRLAPALDGLEA